MRVPLPVDDVAGNVGQALPPRPPASAPCAAAVAAVAAVAEEPLEDAGDGPLAVRVDHGWRCRVGRRCVLVLAPAPAPRDAHVRGVVRHKTSGARSSTARACICGKWGAPLCQHRTAPDASG